MAKGGDKRRLEENRSRLQQLKILIAVANSVYVASRFVLRSSPIISWHGGALVLTSLLYAICYSGIAAALAPHYSDSGELIFAGADLKQGGVISYYHDVIYLSLFCQILGAYTNYVWFIMLTIPGYALYMFVTQVMLPSWNTPNEIPESEADRRRREKRERQAARAEKFARRR